MLKSDWPANRSVKFEHTFIPLESLVSNSENRSSVFPFVLELLRKQLHARPFWIGHSLQHFNSGVTKYPGGQIFGSKSSLRPSLERKKSLYVQFGCTTSYRVQMHKQQTNFLLYCMSLIIPLMEKQLRIVFTVVTIRESIIN